MELSFDSRGRVVIADEYSRIKLSELLPGDCILFYYGNKLTEFHGRYRKKNLGRSTNPPYHAAMVYGVIGSDCIILDPAATTSLQSLSKYLVQNTKRIDIIRYNLTESQRNICQESARSLIKKLKLYDVKGYGAFISQMPGFGWFKYIMKPSESKFYCSDAVAYCIQDRAGYQVSQKDHNFTAPIDMQLFALERPSNATLYTLKQRNEVI
jgi:hypothetical protein